MIEPSAVQSPPIARSKNIPNLRWFVCGLLFYATTVNYMDRLVMGILKPTITQDLHWTESDYARVTTFFQLGYAIMMPLAGRLIDWLGLRIGYPLAATLWSLSSIAHAFAGNVFQFSAARLGLGLGEAANFPSAIKAVTDWFPRKERALAIGVFNSGSNIGAVVAPLTIPLVVARFGWHAAFVFTGMLSGTFALLWACVYREPANQKLLSPAEAAYIRSDSDPRAAAVQLSYAQLLQRRAAWAFLLGKFLTDPVWWFYLFWLPGFLNEKYHVDLVHLGPPLVAIYLAADAGSIGGGGLSSFLLKIGWRLGRARKTALLTCALAAVAVMFVPLVGGRLWLTVLLVALAASAHQGWSANLYAVAADCFPRTVIGSVVGLGGLGGAIGGVLVQPAIGWWLDHMGKNYSLLFVIAGSLYLAALIIIQLLLSHYEQQAI